MWKGYTYAQNLLAVALSCVSFDSQHCQKLNPVKPIWHASCCNENPISAILWVLPTDTEADQTTVAGKSEKQRALPAAPTGLG